MLRIFIGYDDNEAIAYHVLAHSILSRASRPVALIPLVKNHLSEYTRERTPTESTDFSLTRFLVPYLSDYTGHSVFMDCDMLCRADINELLDEIARQPAAAVLCCQHDYTPRTSMKCRGQVQTKYPCKNWSSLMVFNNALCTSLTPEYVNRASGLELHRFLWIDASRIGTLPLTWNWLVGEYDPNPNAKCLHYTLGGPWFAECATVDHADLWHAERALLL